MDRKNYDSSLQNEPIEVKAPYYNAINPTKVWFEQERIFVSLNANGHIEFYDESENSLGFADFPVSDDPSKYAHTAQYGEIRCSSDGKQIKVSLPIYWWSDSYPDCDGEFDRWTRHIERWFDIVFNCKSGEMHVI